MIIEMALYVALVIPVYIELPRLYRTTASKGNYVALLDRPVEDTAVPPSSTYGYSGDIKSTSEGPAKLYMFIDPG